ncbi:MAG: oxaloacetate-decarboxylating malate dehydrogenase [Candidatus Riflebacteria bacterium]|nr:oxaloacetate-decarboxylating malate dehydrogenase [Candidatus Riflebacteria bacterium]
MEIERKFLLKNDNWRSLSTKNIKIKQGYISTNPESTVRIRIADSKGFLTIKGKGNEIAHPEYEYEIPTKDAEEMFNLFCKKTGIEKTRYIVDFKGHKWEIDEFNGRHKGLILAEVELKSEVESVELPDWIGEEVTGNPKYYNSNLAKENEELTMIDNLYKEYLSKATNLEKCLYLYDLYHKDSKSFFELANNHRIEFLPILYTPTIGDAVINYSKNYKYPLGLTISYEDKGNIKKILEKAKQGFGEKEMTIAVVTDGEGVLGIGDQGAGAIYISLGKLMVYSLCGGLDQSLTLPIMLDVGTNNQALLEAPEYKGWRHSRIAGKDYYDFIDEFVQGFAEVFPNSFLHWEDFGRDNARPVLDKYREFHPSFNDDIQGTGIVALAAVLCGIKKSGIPLAQHKICILGAGTAGCGIANQICKGISLELGIPFEEESRNFYLVDKEGLLLNDNESLLYFQKSFCHSKQEVSNWKVKDFKHISLLEVIQNVHPTILIGCSTASGAFTDEILKEIYSYNKKPIIMPISNPTSKAEATPERILNCTQGNALIATGSPFKPVVYNGKSISISQCNNALVFPGIGIGMIKSKARVLTDSMLLKASKALAKEAELDSLSPNQLLPSFERVLEISKIISDQIC